MNPILTLLIADLQVLIFSEEAALVPFLAAWDNLALSRKRPFCAPGWMLSWWRAAHTGKAELRVAVVMDGDRVIGIGPFFAQLSRGLNELRLLSAGFSHRIGPLALPEDEERVASALAQALPKTHPRPASVVFEGIDAEDRWPDLIADAWPGRRPHVRTDLIMEAPVIELNRSYDAWLERRTRNFRKLARRTGRRLEESGIESRIAADGEAIHALMHLHDLRWRDRGGSGLDDNAERVLAGATARMQEGRLEIVLLEGPEGPISAELMLRTGTEATIWATGFDPAWARLAPGLQVRAVSLRHAAEQGVELIDLGGGGDEYKSRMSDRDMPIAWRTVFPRGFRYPLIRLRLAPKHLRHWLRQRVRSLPPGLRERLHPPRGRAQEG
jgi:CelD/BcsL family acetyltransferase involved in cellulose biosynthesis